MAKIDDLLGAFRRKFLDHMVDDFTFWRPSKKTLHEDDADGGVPKPPPPPPPPPPPTSAPPTTSTPRRRRRPTKEPKEPKE
jgi:hypothetical protein